MAVEQLPEARAVVARVVIGGIVDERSLGTAHDPAQLGTPPVEQRAKHGHIGDHRPRPHARQARQPRPTRGAHQEGLGLVVGMVRRQDGRRPDRAGLCGKQGIADLACLDWMLAPAIGVSGRRA